MKLTAQRIQEISADLAPEFAPLPRPFIKHLLCQDSRYLVLPSSYVMKTFSLQDQLLERIWRRFVYCRTVIYSYLHPFVMTDKLQQDYSFFAGSDHAIKAHRDPNEQETQDTRLTTGWLLKTLEECFPSQEQREAGDLEEAETYTPSMQMVSDWHQRGLLRYSEWGMPKANSAAAILIMRRMIRKARSWLPSTMDRDEPDCWVWGLLPGEQTPTPHALPLAPTTPSHTLLMSPYPLVALEGKWTLFHKRGAVRWAGTCLVNGQPFWDVSEEGMQAWGAHAKTPMCFQHLDQLSQLEENQPGLSILTPGDRQTYRRLSLHPTADELLIKLGVPFLTQHLKRFYAAESPMFSQIVSSRN